MSVTIKDLRPQSGGETPLKDGDTPTIVPSIAEEARTETEIAPALPALSNEEIARYSRHLIMPEVGMAGQRRLKAASVLMIGTGGLGAPVGMYLAAAGVGRIVYLSFYGAAPDATFTLARDHWATEEHIRGTGLAHTFVRDNMYLDFFPFMVEDGVIRGPAGDGRVAAVAQDDIAEVVSAVLREPAGYDAATLSLTGREALTFHDIAEVLGARYEPETVEEAYASRAKYGAPDWGTKRLSQR